MTAGIGELISAQHKSSLSGLDELAILGRRLPLSEGALVLVSSSSNIMADLECLKQGMTGRGLLNTIGGCGMLPSRRLVKCDAETTI